MYILGTSSIPWRHPHWYRIAEWLKQIHIQWDLEHAQPKQTGLSRQELGQNHVLFPTHTRIELFKIQHLEQVIQFLCQNSFRKDIVWVAVFYKLILLDMSATLPAGQSLQSERYSCQPMYFAKMLHSQASSRTPCLGTSLEYVWRRKLRNEIDHQRTKGIWFLA